MAGATLLETFYTIIPAADLVAHANGKSSVAAFAAWIADEGSTVFHAGADGTDAPVGYAVLTTPDFSIQIGPADIELRRIYTLVAVHGTGLGTALLEAALTDAQRRGCARMLLGVHPDNRRARQFYERNGFRVIGEREFGVGSQIFTDPIYARDL